ncbi:MAG TPA: Ig-like domain-containing protein, partial [Planctomycetaceae bacterium]|nr:Ig-like domain-containing protein [Planctomycetaceae bacterium]
MRSTITSRTADWVRTALVVCMGIVAIAGCDAGSTTTPPAVGEGIRMDQAGVQIDEGGTTRLRILIVDANGQTRDMGTGSQVVWSVHDPEIASVQAGLVKGLRPGTTRVTATVSGRQSAHADIHVLSVPGSVDVLFGDRQAGIVGLSLSTPIRLRVLDRRGQPMTNAQLQFTPVQSSGSVSPSVATLGADGTAELSWTLGTRAGPQAVEVRIAGRESVAGVLSAEAAPGPVARVQVTPGNALTNPGGQVRYSAAALDQYGNVVTNARLEWAVVDAQVASISADGTARALIAGETQVEAIYFPSASSGDAAQAPTANRGQGWLRSQKGTGYPAQVTDLRSPSQSTSTVTLSFTQVGDGAGGPADYQVRYAATPIGGDFATATIASQGSCSSPIDGQT